MTSIADKSTLVFSTISLVQEAQKIGWAVKPLFTLGIWKQVAAVAIRSLQRSQFVALPQMCRAGDPVDIDRREGVLPFGLGI
jgi:hypothetical protein